MSSSQAMFEYICLRRRFSSYNSFTRFVSLASISPIVERSFAYSVTARKLFYTRAWLKHLQYLPDLCHTKLLFLASNILFGYGVFAVGVYRLQARGKAGLNLKEIF